MEEIKISKYWDKSKSIAEVRQKLKQDWKRGEKIIDLGEAVSEIIEVFPVDHLPDGPPEEDFIPIEWRIIQLKREFDSKAQEKAFADNQSGYEYSKYIANLLNHIVNYFTGKESKFNPKKGLFIIGTPGAGKSFILEMFSLVLKNASRRLGGANYRENNMGFVFKSVTDLCTEFNSANNEAADKLFLEYGKKLKGWNDGIIWNHVCLDDIGKEVVEKSYTYTHNPIKTIINARYDRRNSGPHEMREMGIFGPITHATSNYGIESLKKLYGPALVDRFYQMFNIIEFESDKSFRR